MSKLHPDLKWRAPFLKFLLPSATPTNLRFRRAMLNRVTTPIDPGVAVEDKVITHQGLDVEVRIYRPERASGPLPVMLWLHGGGLILGNHIDNQQCSRLVTSLDIAVISINYRLAPEHPYPSALHDILAVVDWYQRKGAAHDFDPTRWALGGQSAGGGLAAVATQHLHDQGVHPCGQLLIYPMLDDRTTQRTDIQKKEHLVWNNLSNTTGWTSYLGESPESAGILEEAVPARREDLTGLAPAWIGVGTQDLFYNEDMHYADRLREAGVDCVVHVAEGMIHGFDMIVPTSEVTQEFNASQDTFLKRVFGQ